jgi:hypothetical protein
MYNKKRFYTLLVLSMFVIAIGTAAIWRSQSVRAIQNSEETSFGFISLAAGQTLRFNVVALGGPDTSPARRVRMVFDIYGIGDPNECPGGAVAACTNNLRLIRRESCVARLRAREGASCELTAAADGTFINPTLFVEEAGIQPCIAPTIGNMRPCIAPTVEVREAGRTLFVHPGVAKGFNPQPDPPRQN